MLGKVMRYPEKAPVTYWTRIKNRYPKLERIRLPTLGTVGVVGTVALICAAFYAVAIYPMMNTKYYQAIQKENLARRGVDRDEWRKEIAGDQNPWSDPFEKFRKSKEKKNE
ncbi:hypothetical protein DdX_09881 [Ditylenchus destructor]|uniref:Uncharacterized protein n=1 Tax=Ditylenchus destructor TaxID=166010 RepID=A0AAD4N030_9BILA|nr:hypothetical protein DdX_09881 [Ditylenchus destructor]